MCTLYVPLVHPSSRGGWLLWLRLLLLDCGVQRVNQIPPMSHTHTITFTRSPLPASISWCYFLTSFCLVLFIPLWYCTSSHPLKRVTDMCYNEKNNMLKKGRIKILQILETSAKTSLVGSTRVKNSADGWPCCILTSEGVQFLKGQLAPHPPTPLPAYFSPQYFDFAKFLGWR